MTMSIEEAIKRLRSYEIINSMQEKEQLAEWLEELKMLRELKAEHRKIGNIEGFNKGYNSGWIPCSERLPEETEKLYLVTYKKFILGNFRYFMDIAYLSPLPDGTLEWVSEKAPVTRKVEAWQDLPEEYKGIK